MIIYGSIDNGDLNDTKQKSLQNSAVDEKTFYKANFSGLVTFALIAQISFFVIRFILPYCIN